MMYKNNEAVSAVIGVILMTAAIVIVAVSVYVYVNGLISDGFPDDPDPYDVIAGSNISSVYMGLGDNYTLNVEIPDKLLRVAHDGSLWYSFEAYLRCDDDMSEDRFGEYLVSVDDYNMTCFISYSRNILSYS